MEELGQFQTIKIPLKRVLRDPEKNLDIILDAVKNVHIIVTISYQLVRLYYLKLFESNQPLPIIDKQTYQNAISIINFPNKKVTNPEKQSLKDFYHAEFKSTIPSNFKFEAKGLSTILQSATTEMITAYHNNIKVHFITRLRKVIKQTILNCPEFANLQRYEIRRGVNLVFNCLWERDSSQLNQKLVSVYQECLKNYIPTEPYQESLAYDLEANPDHYLLPTFKMCQYLEKSGQKLFQVLPFRRTNVPCHLSLDTNDLIYIFDLTNVCANYPRQQDLLNNYNKNHYLRYLLWNHLFKMDDKIFKLDLNKHEAKPHTSYQFFYSLATDGVSCSLKFCHPKFMERHRKRYLKLDKKPKEPAKRKSEKPTPKPKPNKVEKGQPHQMSELSDEARARVLNNYNLVGCDPGMSNLIQIVDANGKQLKYTKRQRYQETYINQNRELYLKLVKEFDLNTLEKPLNQFNHKSLNYQHFKDYLTKKNEIMITVMEPYQQLVFRNMKLRHYIYKRKSEARLVRNIKETFGQKCTILYGNWSRKSQMKYHAPVPGRGLLHLLALYFLVIITNEAKSSSVCYYCQGPLVNRKIEMKTGSKRLHRCLVCEKCCSSQNGSKIRRFMNRDIMASLNILKLGKCDLANQERPEAYQRKQYLKKDERDPFGDVSCALPKKMKTPKPILKLRRESA